MELDRIEVQSLGEALDVARTRLVLVALVARDLGLVHPGTLCKLLLGPAVGHSQGRQGAAENPVVRHVRAAA